MHRLKLFQNMVVVMLLVFPSMAVLASVLPYGHSVRSVDDFLTLLQVNSGSISNATKNAGGTALACAILSAASNKKLVTAINGAVYTQEREAHW
jgi:hypothetical protein